MEQDKEIKIVQLEFPENIRRRPGMFIGSVEAPSVLLREAIDNSIDEIYGCSTCDRIFVDTKSSKWNIVADNGRGMPITKTEEGITMAEMAVSRVNAGSKFDKGNEVAVGMNGVGIKATNALSNKFVILSRLTDQKVEKSIIDVIGYWKVEKEDINEHFYFLYYEKGIKKEEGCLSKEEIEAKFGFQFPEGMSTITAFQPDDTIFRSVNIQLPSRNLKYLSFIASEVYHKENIKITLDGQVLAEVYEPFSNVFTSVVTGYEGSKSTFIVNFQYDKNLNNIDVTGSVNSLPVDRGIHVELIKNAYKQAIKDYFKIGHDYLLYGIQLNVVVLAGEVDFSSQTKERLTKLPGIYATYPEGIQELEKGFFKAFSSDLEGWKGHVERLEELYKSMVQISTIDRIKSMVNVASDNKNQYRSHMPANVDDATSADRENCSLYIVEGQSAGGNMVQARDRRYDAIFYLRGKPMNAVFSDQDAMLENREMNAIISAIGVGVDEYQVTENPHFGKIIIATDADPDGLNIASMLIAFFCKRMQKFVEEGMLYVVQTPLFIQGDKVAYLGDDVDSIIDKTKPFSRIKGLGELDPSELEQHIFNKDTRRLIRITMRNAKQAIDLITSTYARKMLMLTEGILKDPYKVDPNLG